MEEEPVVDVAQACRLCLMNENDTKILVDEEMNKIREIGIKIFEITDVPALICTNCHSILLFILKFHKMCENSLKYLSETYTQDEAAEVVTKTDPDLDIGDSLSDEDYSAEIITSDEVHEEVVTEIVEANGSEEEQLQNDDVICNEEYIYEADDQQAEEAEEKIKVDRFEYERLEAIEANSESEEAIWVEETRKHEEEDDELTVYILDHNSQLEKEHKIKDGQTLLRAKNNELSLKHKTMDPAAKVYACEICGNTYRKMGALESHRRRHRNWKPYECEICSEAFDYNFKLERHMRKHTGAKPFKCEYCDRAFVDRSTMSRHQKIHYNERNYCCTMCGKSFTYYSVLKTHIMSHTGEKPYACGICDKGFHRASDLKNHLETLQHRKDPRVADLLKNIRRKDEVTLNGFT